MTNLRLLEIKTSDSTSIHARFTEELDTLLNTSNVVITSNTPGSPDPEVLAVSVSKDILSITTQPMTPYAAYFVKFQSSNSVDFKSKRGNFLLEDNKTNISLLLGAEEPDNPIRPFLLGYLKDNIYDTDDTLLRDIINSQADVIAKALYAIKQAKNDNYLKVLVENELKTRGAGPFDRLNEEGAFEVVRVGTTPSGTFVSGSKSFSEFPEGPITLQATQYTETLTAGSGAGTFNKLILTTSKYPVTKLISLVVSYQAGGTATYSVETLGYQLQNSRYDQEYASTLLTLEENQIKLSDAVLEDSGFVPPSAGDEITIVYEYKALGKIIDESSVVVSQVLDAVREVAPPIVTQFTLRHFPIVTASDILASVNGVQFLDPNANPPFSDTHPAFDKELPFRFDGLPANPGEYSVNYETGQVYVYGEEINDGTGDFPPVCTYKYRKNFTSRLDFTYDPDVYEVVASPLRDLAGQEVKISFDYENTLIPNIDFVAQVHSEVLDERVQNRVTSTGSLSVLNTPITNVFRIFNETSGELYRIQRWSDHTVYFSSSVPPQIANITRERVAFTDVTNEVLVVSEELINAGSVRIFKIPLANNRIMSASEDVVGSSFNSSASFSRTDLFSTELYFDYQILELQDNLDRLIVGQYQIDYSNGIVYVAVSDDETYDLGTINYKKSSITTANDHIISVSELYSSINVVSGINKRIPYTTFSDTEIVPITFDIADERFLNGDETLAYTVVSDTITVTDDIQDVRGVYDAADLNQNIIPTNFGEGSAVSANVITLTPVSKNQTATIASGLEITVDFISNGAEIADVISVLRLSDNVELWDDSGSFSGYDITLSGINGATTGQEVLVSYTVKLNGGATPIVDYNRGDYYVDYTYLIDEILVSYEYGDNNIDFRQSDALDEGDTYYVTYKVGALRNALLKNFGSLVNIPILNNFDTSLPRERYREALMAALQSFTKGPTLPSMKSLVSTITHIDPEIIESAFQNWSLGISHLYFNSVETSGDVQLMVGKYDHGVLLSNSGETISLPASSNLRLEEGTFETWAIPEWDGLDNDASLTFSVNRDGYVLPSSEIFIGSTSYNPTYDDEFKFTLNKSDEIDPSGLPSAVYTNTGLFVYYDTDTKRWKFLVKERVADGYVYTGSIESSGEFYDVKFLPGLKEINDFTRTIKNKIEFELHIDSYDELSPDGYVDGYNLVDGYYPADGYIAGYSFDGFQFMADEEHYFFDVGTETDRNRISLLKDGRGYLSFRVWDKGDSQGKRNKREISYDISDWSAGEKHHIATTWRLNSADRRDEIHLFVDGFEVPNIMKYGGRPEVSSTDRFRTIKPEILAGTVPLNCVVGNDLVTVAGSAVVTSATLDFAALGILAGHTIDIRESGFSTYNILSVSSSSLTLDTSMPSTFSDARFSVNPFSAVVSTEVDLYENIAVSIISNGEETELPGLRADLPAYEITKDAFNQNVLTILGEAQAGDQIAIRTLGLNHRRVRERHFIWGDTSSVLKTQLPPPISLEEAKIYAVLLPLVNVGPDNATFGSGVFTLSGLTPTQPTNADEGRTLSIRMTGGNVDFTTPATVTIYGTTASGAISETITFTETAVKYSSEKFKTISSAEVVVKPVVSSRNSVSVEIKERYSITYPDGNNIYPVIRFSYKTQTGSTLSGTSGSTTVTDTNGYFTASSVGQLLIISSPGGAAGSYTITARNSSTSVEVTPALPVTFTGGIYNIYNISIARSGFQNGFFTLEQAGTSNTPFTLKQGWYEFDYSVYLEIPMDPLSNSNIYFGSDFQGKKQSKAILDEIRILSKTLTDVRIGESIADGEDSITTDYTSLRPFKSDSDTLVLLHLDKLPVINEADYWTTTTREFIQSGTSVNENFEKSIVLTDKPLVVDNKGLLSTSSEGSIEFWISPRYDTYNDPNFRYYFDASGSIVEEVTSITNGTVKVAGRISNVLSVRLQTDNENSGTNYFVNGEVLSDFQTIKLGKALPYQKTPVKINYIPSGLSGDRISIYKDQEGFLTFNVRANGVDYQVRQPIFWERDSWHRIMATYKFNRSDNRDEIRLFVDGEERGLILFGSGIVFNESLIFGQGFSGNNGSILTADINFSDPINQFYVGSDYLTANTAQARIDNLRLSNKARNPLIVAGQPRDINYSSNVNVALPVVEDVFTTYLLNFNTLIEKNEDFALLRDEKFGIFNFTMNIIDSFGILSGNAKIQQVLETLIKSLKPAQSKVTLNYV